MAAASPGSDSGADVHVCSSADRLHTDYDALVIRPGHGFQQWSVVCCVNDFGGFHGRDLSGFCPYSSSNILAMMRPVASVPPPAP